MVQTINRVVLNYENLSQKWSQTTSTYNKQYCSIYTIRLKQMEVLLKRQIARKWGDKYPIIQLHKVSEERNQKCVVIGTLFKNQKLKPSILKQLAEGNQLVPQPILSHFTDKSDELFIEDELQRYQVISTLHCDNVVTGITCALLGTGDDKGRFMVDDYVFARLREQISRPVFEDSAYLVFLSGLDFVNIGKFAINLKLVTAWLAGLIGDLENIATSKIVRLIIAGGSIRNDAEEVEPSISLLSRRTESTQSIEAVKEFDTFLLELSRLIDVDVMPGENDPSNNILPQKPMHFCMFPQSTVYKSLNQVSNPYSFSIGGVKILGSSGQPVTDIMNFSDIPNSLEALEWCLKWSHLAPTAPDTLGCFPFFENDPFIIDECPHVFFAGNQKEFGTKECKGDDGQTVRLISIPQFSNSLQACVLDLKSLHCSTVNFQTV